MYQQCSSSVPEANNIMILKFIKKIIYKLENIYSRGKKG